MNTHRKTLIRGSAVSAVGMIALGLMNYFVRRQLARNLTENDYGFFYSMFSLFSLATTVLELGVQRAATILIAGHLERGETDEAQRFFSIAFFFNLVTGMLLALFFAVSANWWLRDFFHFEAGRSGYMIFLFYLFLLPLSSVLQGTVAAVKDFGVYNLLLNLRVAVVLIGAALLLNRCELTVAAAVFALGEAVTVLASFAYLHWKRNFRIKSSGVFSSANFKSVFSLGVWIAVSAAALSMMINFNTLVLTRMTDLGMVALFNIALPLMQIAQSMVMIVPQVFTPVVAGLWQTGNRDEIRSQCRHVTLLMAFGAIPGTAATWLCAPTAIRILFGAEFIGAANTLVILVAGIFFFALTNLYLAALNTGGDQKGAALWMLPAAGLNLLLNIALVKGFSIEGAAAATSLSYIALAIFLGLRLKRLLCRD